MDTKKMFAVAVVAILLAGALVFLTKGEVMGTKSMPPLDMPDKYMVLVEEPQSEEEYALAAALSPLVMWGEYHPFFVLSKDGLDTYQLWTIEHMTIRDATKMLFTFGEDSEVVEKVYAQVNNIEHRVLNPETLRALRGFDGEISVGSYEEAIWVSGLAAYENKKIVYGEPTYSAQEEVWADLFELGIPADYVIVTNPLDYGDNFTSTGIRTKDDGEPMATPEPYNGSFHFPSLSIVAAEMAAKHNAYVMTDIEPSMEEIGFMDLELNQIAIGTLLQLREMNAEYGPIEYICMIGSAEAVPQFELPDHTDSDPANCEGDGMVESDVLFGFLDEDHTLMDAAVGRIINYNMQGATNQIARTFGYHLVQDTVTVDYTTGTEEVYWRTHGSAWNGYEVADQRLQMTPGYFLKRDLEDEGFTADYMRTTGNGGWRSENRREMDFKPVMESSGIVGYRGHGSWHATFYVYEPEEPTDPQSKTRLEGNDTERPQSPSVVEYYLPPQVGVLVSCENAKIHGCHWWGDPVNNDMLWAPNYFYAGAVGLIAATEVSFSNLAQDAYTLAGLVTGNMQWDLNNCWFAFPVDGMLNHEETFGSLGKAHMWAENRYINNPNHDFVLNPFDEMLDAHAKEITMFACYGDPAFVPFPDQNRPGANDFDPWHNGPEDV